nr:RluA family pseudouridine synthase [uncultured Holophaga sp.]
MNQGCTYTEQIHPRWQGRPLQDYLSGRYEHTPEGEWRSRIEQGLVQLDGKPALPEAPLRQGQVLTWHRPPWEEPEAPLDWGLLYEDERVLAVSKPSGLPTLPGAGFLEHTLLHQVRLTHPEASPVHRLGRGTSGLVLFARSVASRDLLCSTLRDRAVVKLYRALISGCPREDRRTLDTPIGPLPHPTLGTLHGPSPQGKPALSHVRVLERRAEGTLVEVRIETGRPHQIRIHMATWGHPLLGDPLYGPGGSFLPGAVPGDLGYLLHAWRLSLPALGLELESPPPEPLADRGAHPYP